LIKLKEALSTVTKIVNLTHLLIPWHPK